MNDPELTKMLDQFTSEVLPKIADSAVSLSLVPGDTGDLKYWLELAGTIMLEKPIVLLVIGDRHIPPKLELIADKIIRCTESMEGVGAQVAEFLDELERIKGDRGGGMNDDNGRILWRASPSPTFDLIRITSYRDKLNIWYFDLDGEETYHQLSREDVRGVANALEKFLQTPSYEAGTKREGGLPEEDHPA